MLSVSSPIATEAQTDVDAVVPAGKPFAEDLIRADQSGSKQVAIDHSVSKARQIIDEKGVKLLGQSHL